jgi:hypothetical protein
MWGVEKVLFGKASSFASVSQMQFSEVKIFVHSNLP